eukprot:sb/3471387/
MEDGPSASHGKEKEGPSASHGEASSSGGDEGSPSGGTGVGVLGEKGMETSSGLEAAKDTHIETADPPQEDTSEVDEKALIPETIPESTVNETPVDTSNNKTPSSTETPEKSTEKMTEKTPIEDVEWRHFPTPETLLEDLGADCLKEILAKNQKCERKRDREKMRERERKERERDDYRHVPDMIF